MLAAACAAPPAPLPPERIPLARLERSGRAVVERGRLDFGEPAARERMVSGWGPDERTERTSFVWSGAEPARWTFDLVRTRDLELTLAGWSYPFADGAPQSVTLSLNGRELARRALGPGPGSFVVELPRSALRAGQNEVALQASRWVEREPRWSVAWDGARLAEEGGAPLAEPPPPRFEGEDLVLPAGTAIEWALEIPDGSALAWEGVAARGAARLEVESGQDGVAARGATRVRDAGPGHAPLAAGGLVAFALRAPGESGEVRVAAPALRQRAPDDLPEPPAAAAAAAPAPARPNLVVYLVDTLRSDHLGCYGYPRPTSPALDAFARRAVLFENGRAQASWTKPAVASVLTGLHPITHGAQQRPHRISQTVETLAERLRGAGYETALFTTNANVAARFGFDQGFETVRYLATARGRKRIHVDSRAINARVFEWLERRAGDRPFFLFVHTLDPHDPYRPEESFRRRLAPEVDVERSCCARSNELARLTAAEALERAAGARQLYDAEIAQNDAAFGELLSELERRSLAEASAVLFTSDHGEEFLDHGGWKHGWTLYEEMLRIPFVLALPGGAHGGRRLAGPADQVDVAPTLLALAGLPVPGELPGRNLLDDLDRSARALPARASFAWLERGELAWSSVARGSWKLVRFRGAWTPPLGRRALELYDLAGDPAERSDLALRRPVPQLWLDGALAETVARHRASAAAEETPIDPELERALRALGYV
jgi:arylsulfatase A-like enzyme